MSLPYYYKEYSFYVLCFSFVCLGVLFIIYSYNALNVSKEIQKISDRIFMFNLGWTELEFNEWMEKERQEMTDEYFEIYAKKNVKWWNPYIPLNFTRKKRPKK